MEQISELPFLEEEMKIVEQLHVLFDEAYEYGKKIQFIKGYNNENLITDGIFPYYSMQKIKVLFVGRDQCEVFPTDKSKTSHSYTYEMYKNLTSGKYKLIYKNLYKIAYAFNNNFPEWSQIPEYTSDNLFVDKGVSYAFINCSKFTNESDKGPNVDIELLVDFTEKYSRMDLFKRQIQIINPDIIITMNLSDLSDGGFKMDYLGECEHIGFSEQFVSIYKYFLNDRLIPLFDTYHFSWRHLNGMNAIDKLYSPLQSGYIDFMSKYQAI
jgi:hypothetical protein